jgi:hypothetical protein
MANEYAGFDNHGFTEWLKDFLPTGVLGAFVNDKNGRILVLGEFANKGADNEKHLYNQLFISNDGRTFRQMSSGRHVVPGGRQVSSYKDPASEKMYRIHLNDDVCLRCEDTSELVTRASALYDVDMLVKYKPNNLHQAQFIPVPEIRKPEFLFEFDDEQYVYIDALKYYGYTSKQLRLFVGTPDSMQQQEIKKYLRVPDTNDIEITTDAGLLYIPINIREGHAPHWMDKPIEGLDLSKDKFLALITSFNLIPLNI